MLIHLSGQFCLTFLFCNINEIKIVTKLLKTFFFPAKRRVKPRQPRARLGGEVGTGECPIPKFQWQPHVQLLYSKPQTTPFDV